MIVKKKDGKYEYRCDYCLEIKNHTLLSDTGNDRWCVVNERFGREAICEVCRNALKKY